MTLLFLPERAAHFQKNEYRPAYTCSHRAIGRSSGTLKPERPASTEEVKMETYEITGHWNGHDR
jgi:hypothetical protein